MTDIVFFIEVRVREFDAAAAIRRHLKARHGLDMHIAALGELTQQDLALDPKLVVLPWVQSAETSRILRPIVNAYPRAAFLNMCWEQLLLSHVVAAKAPQGTFARDTVYHHSWGPFRTAYLERLGIARDRIFENGNPLYTLYQPRYRALCATKAALAQRHGLDPAKPWVLFPENYGWAFLSERQISRGFIQKGVSRKQADTARAFQVESLREALRWFSQVDEPIEFILRPRPAVSIAAYQEAFAREGLTPGPSVRIVKDGPVRDWVHASDLVLSSFSTTLLEAAVAGKPAFAIEPVPFADDVVAVEWMDQVERVTSLAAFKALLRDPRALPPADRLAAFAKSVAHPCEDALIGAADMMKRIVEMSAATQRAPLHMRTPLLSHAKEFGRQIRQALHLAKPKDSHRVQSDMPNITQADVLARTAQVDAIFSRPTSSAA